MKPEKADIKDKYLFYHTLIVQTLSPSELNLFRIHNNKWEKAWASQVTRVQYSINYLRRNVF
jgi:hypothetical protein